MKRMLIGVLAWGLLTPWAAAGADVPASQRALTPQEERMLLIVREPQLTLDHKRNEMEKAKLERDRIEGLFEEKLVRVEKVDEAVQSYDEAVFQYEQARIQIENHCVEVMWSVPNVRVTDARKYRNEEGDVIASVTIYNYSDIGFARIAKESSPEVLRDEPLESLVNVKDIVVSLVGQVGTGSAPVCPLCLRSVEAIVADPFQRTVDELAHGEEKVLEYRLLREDVEEVTVRLEYANRERQFLVCLRKESQQHLPQISSTRYWQVGRLGTKIRYDLALERLGRTEQSFSLVVLNLPPEIKAAFLDPSSGASLTQVKFTGEISTQNLCFKASIPRELPADLIDAGISFYIVVTWPSELEKVYELKKTHSDKIPPGEVAKINGNSVELVLISCGVGEL